MKGADLEESALNIQRQHSSKEVLFEDICKKIVLLYIFVIHPLCDEFPPDSFLLELTMQFIAGGISEQALNKGVYQFDALKLSDWITRGRALQEINR
ncbi:hypothetical protein T01_15690 [Trichinella spiralis]|uniref:Uncharacterized protein n=1 Tax=Trichinella spiralis TaxID=6334 RepID=A0A0V1AV03_TRISP|nr:hypothetical protein T01_15690 [Trichinella spiralis]